MSVVLYRVGGCVRDKLMNVKPKDIDFAVEASSFDEMRDYISSRGTIFLEKPEFFTIRAKIGGESADFTLCRKEGFYTDGRRPDSCTIAGIREDLSRRDFTINAIAENVETGEIVDPFFGRIDIDRKMIRCVNQTEDRFTEDSLRMLRAMRFSITKGFHIHSDIERCFNLDRFVNLLQNVSVERIREELVKCFTFSTPATIAKLNEFPKLRDFMFANGNLILIPTIRN